MTQRNPWSEYFRSAHLARHLNSWLLNIRSMVELLLLLSPVKNIFTINKERGKIGVQEWPKILAGTLVTKLCIRKWNWNKNSLKQKAAIHLFEELWNWKPKKEIINVSVLYIKSTSHLNITFAVEKPFLGHSFLHTLCLCPYYAN